MKKGGAEKTNPAKENIATVLLGAPEIITECAIVSGSMPGGTCLDKQSSDIVLGALGSHSIEDAKVTVGCDSERCLVEKARPIIGRHADAILVRNFKLDGPTNADLLSNVDIDGILRQWSRKWKEFYPYNFNMLNYASYRYSGNDVVNEPDTLATITFESLYKNGYKCAACVINSDVYQGGGKHWMALFVDTREKDRTTVEFFNSSGRPPVPEWVNWMVKTKIGLQNLGFKRIDLVNCCSVEHQQSQSECGVYSLYYIWCRLNGVAPEAFTRGKSIHDKKMFEFRQHLFAKPIAADGGKFNWDEYQKTVRIKWA